MARKRTTSDGLPLTRRRNADLVAQQIRKLEGERMKRSWHLDPPDDYARNEHILSWWRPEYDAILSELIDEYGHGWHQCVTQELEKRLPTDQVADWRTTDPLCAQYAYYNVLTNFAVARARTTGLEDGLPGAETVECTVCGEPFLTTSLKAGVWRDLGTDFCGVCLARAFWLDGDMMASREAILRYIARLYETWNRVPPQTITSRDIFGASFEQRRRLIKLLIDRPTAERVRETFGSWFEALVAADVLDGAAQRMARGTRCLANDGHVCLSIGEKTIDDLMYAAGIEHTKEPAYPEGRMRADFQVGSSLVEYFGLAGDDAYDAKIELKRRLAATHELALIEVYPGDLADAPALVARLTVAAAKRPTA
jgi:hypothetical protein